MNLPEPKRKASGIYFLDLRDRGLGRVSLNTRDLATARARRREYALGHRTLTPAEPTRNPDLGPTMKDLFARAERTIWAPGEAKSQRTIRSNVKILTELVGDEPVTAMTYTRLEQLSDQLRARGYAPGTVKRKMDAVSRVLSMATKWTDDKGRPLLPYKPKMPPIRVSNLKDRVVSPAEEVAIFEAIEARRVSEPARQWPRFGALISFLFDTGARLGEALNLSPEDRTIARGANGAIVDYVTFARYSTKNDKPRSIPLTDRAASALNFAVETSGLKGGREVYFPMTSGTAWYMWDNIREDLAKRGVDISDVTLHTLRHTCLTRLAEGDEANGVPPMDLLRLQMWAGHSDPKITAGRYAHLRVDHLIRGLDILQGSSGGNPAIPTFTEAPANGGEVGTIVIH